MVCRRCRRASASARRSPARFLGGRGPRTDCESGPALGRLRSRDPRRAHLRRGHGRAARTNGSGRCGSGGPLRLAVAGAESTVAIGVARLGGTARWVGVVGDDEVGALVTPDAGGRGRRDRRHRRRPRAADRPDVQGAANRSRHPRPVLPPSTAPARRWRPSTSAPRTWSRARWLHLSGITPALSPSARDAVRHAAELAAASGTRTCLDLNYRSALWSPDEAAPELTELVKRSPSSCSPRWRRPPSSPAPPRPRRPLPVRWPRWVRGIVVVKQGADGAVAWRRRHRAPRTGRSDRARRPGRCW